MKETKEVGSISKFKSFNASTFSSPFTYAFDKLFAVTKLIGLSLQNALSGLLVSTEVSV